jgi:hypothetical protein
MLYNTVTTRCNAVPHRSELLSQPSGRHGHDGQRNCTAFTVNPDRGNSCSSYAALTQHHPSIAGHDLQHMYSALNSSMILAGSSATIASCGSWAPSLCTAIGPIATSYDTRCHKRSNDSNIHCKPHVLTQQSGSVPLRPSKKHAVGHAN